MARSDIIILLDRSGSMQARKADHEGGLRSFVNDSKNLDAEIRLTFVQFDSVNLCEVVIDQQPIADVSPDQIILTPRGGTPLLDAVGEVISRFSSVCSPETIFMIITDGEENSSTKHDKKKIQELVKERETAGWKILYLGANVDEFAEAAGLGLGTNQTLGYRDTSSRVNHLYNAVLSNASATYASLSMGASWKQATTKMDWSETQRKDVKEEEK